MTLTAPRGVGVFVFALLLAGPASAMQVKAPVARGQGGGVRVVPIKVGADFNWAPMKMSFRQENFGGALPSLAAPEIQEPAVDGLPASAIADFQSYRYEVGRVPEEGIPLGDLTPKASLRSEPHGFSEGMSVLQGWSERAPAGTGEKNGRESRGFKETSLVMDEHLRRVRGIRSGTEESAEVFGRRIEEIMVGGSRLSGGGAQLKHGPAKAGGASASGVFPVVSANGLTPAAFEASSQEGPVVGAVPGAAGFAETIEGSPRAVLYFRPRGVPLVVMVVGEKLGFSLFSRSVLSRAMTGPLAGDDGGSRSLNLGANAMRGVGNSFQPAADAAAGVVVGHLAVPMPDLAAMVEGYGLPLAGAGAGGPASYLSFAYSGLTPSDFVPTGRNTGTSFVPEAALPLAGRSAAAAAAFLFLGLLGPLPLTSRSRP